MTGADAGRATTPAAAPNTLSLGTFGASKIVPIVKYVPRELTDAALADIAGEIQYGAAGQRQTVKFTTTVRLQTRYGKPLPPTEPTICSSIGNNRPHGRRSAVCPPDQARRG